MFGRKDKERAAAEENEIFEKLRSLEQREETFNEKRDELISEVAEAKKSAEALDQGLTTIVDHVREIGNEQWSADKNLRRLSETVVDGLEKIASREEDINGVAEKSAAQKEMVLKLIEDSKYYTGITKSLRDTVESYDKKTEVISQQLTKMREFAGNMSTLSLNAAIEAGRLGDGAMKFVRAADEVREFSEEYEGFTEKVKTSAEELRETYQETANQVQKLTAYLRDNNNLLNKIADSIENTNRQLSESKAVDPALFETIKNETQEVWDKVMATVEHQKKILDGMETVGKDYIAENESIKRIEDVIKEMG